MKHFCFTIDDNIRFLKELCQAQAASLFDHPYTAMLRRLHEQFGLSVQLNLFYRMEGFDLSQMSDRYAKEWQAEADWLKLSFHSDRENIRPYEAADYGEVFDDCRRVQQEILRFACPASLAKTTTVHYCQATKEGLQALCDNGVRGLLGLYGSDEQPRSSYGLAETAANGVRNGNIFTENGIAHAAIDMIINTVALSQIRPLLKPFLPRESVRVMIHEQYFYRDYPAYQPDFEEKLYTAFSLLRENGFESCFFEELIG